MAVCLSAGFLAWLAYVATSEWHRSASLLSQQRADAAVELLVTMLTRDMRAVQGSVLPLLSADQLRTDPGATVDHAGRAFARYPYAEAFFAWVDAQSPRVEFYIRLDRYPVWAPDIGAGRFPVVVVQQREIGERLRAGMARDAEHGHRFSVFDLTIGATAYHAVALLSYRDAYLRDVDTAFGFLVNTEWVRRHYFTGLIAELARLDGTGTTPAYAIHDERGRIVAGAPAPAAVPASQRTFRPTFFDPLVVPLDPEAGWDQPSRHWSATATIVADPTLTLANAWADRALLVLIGATVVLVTGLVLIANTARANAQLADLRADFVATVTHELKSPIATIRAINETLAAGRHGSAEDSREYARLAIHETKRLTRLIDNLLAYSRVTDVTQAYSFEPLAVDSLIDEVVHEFAQQLGDAGFELDVSIEPGLPRVRADRTAATLLLGNLVDNAARYSGEARYLGLHARRQGDAVAIDVVDNGVGIPDEEVPHVTRKFFRGRHARSGGSGLGLAIAQRIALDHDGDLTIRSTHGSGTTVTVVLPASR